MRMNLAASAVSILRRGFRLEDIAVRAGGSALSHGFVSHTIDLAIDSPFFGTSHT